MDDIIESFQIAKKTKGLLAREDAFAARRQRVENEALPIAKAVEAFVENQYKPARSEVRYAASGANSLFDQSMRDRIQGIDEAKRVAINKLRADLDLEIATKGPFMSEDRWRVLESVVAKIQTLKNLSEEDQLEVLSVVAHMLRSEASLDTRPAEILQTMNHMVLRFDYIADGSKIGYVRNTGATPIVVLNVNKLLDTAVPSEVRAENLRWALNHEEEHIRIERELKRYDRAFKDNEMFKDTVHELFAYRVTINDMMSSSYAKDYGRVIARMRFLVETASGLKFDDFERLAASGDMDPIIASAAMASAKPANQLAQILIVGKPVDEVMDPSQISQLVVSGELANLPGWKSVVESWAGAQMLEVVGRMNDQQKDSFVKRMGKLNGHVANLVVSTDQASLEFVSSQKKGLWVGVTAHAFAQSEMRSAEQNAEAQLRMAALLADLGVEGVSKFLDMNGQGGTSAGTGVSTSALLDIGEVAKIVSELWTKELTAAAA